MIIENKDISLLARQILSDEYMRIGVGSDGNYPTYAKLALEGDGAFTLYSLRAIERALRINVKDLEKTK